MLMVLKKGEVKKPGRVGQTGGERMSFDEAIEG